MNTWPTMTLGEICDEGGGFIRTGPFGSQLHQSEYTNDPHGIPVIMPKDMVGGRIDRSSIARIDDATANRLSQHLLAVNDVVLSRRGDVGRSAWMFEDDLPVLCGTGSMRIHIGEPASVRPEYLRYFFRSRLAIDYLEGHAIGATMPNLNSMIVTGMPVPILPVALQDLVISVLHSLDDLIENNWRRVAVLEEMARAIYREWFVHFRYPGYENVPLVDSLLGPVPGGWTAGTVSDLSGTVTRGIAPKYADDGAWIVINQKCIRSERVILEQARRQERTVPGYKQVGFGDVLINSTGVGTLGRAAIYRGETTMLTVDSHVTIARPADASLNPWFGMSLVARQPDFERLGTGSTGQTELSRADIGALPMVLPIDNVRCRFGEAVWPLLKGTERLLAWNRNLVTIRDKLLPKLVAGQIDVSSLKLQAPVEDLVA